jgi:FkbM family methyltransferase
MLKAATSRIIPLGDHNLAVRLNCGEWVIVPTWNIDVAVGMIRDGIIEPWTARAVERILKPGDVYVNVGANLGFYMALGVKSVGHTGRVFAIEANPALLPYLMRSVYWSSYPGIIRLYNRVASDEDGRTLSIAFNPQFMGGASVAVPREKDASWATDIANSLWERLDPTRFVQPDGQVSFTYGIPVQRDCHSARLDTILREEVRIDLLHMDIEGSEPAAIAGAQEVITRSSGMAVIMEWSPYYCLAPELLAKTESMWAFFDRLGYSWYRIRHEDFKRGLPAPRLSLIATRAELFSTVHSDVLIVKDLRAYYARWPRLIVKNEAPRDAPARAGRAPKKWQNWMDRLRGFGRATPSPKDGERR